MTRGLETVRTALHLALSELPDNAKPRLFRRYHDALRELDGLEEQLKHAEREITAARIDAAKCAVAFRGAELDVGPLG